MYFLIFCYYHLPKCLRPSVYLNLNPCYPRMFCDNFGWSGKSLQTSMWTYFSFVNKFESPSLRCALCKFWWNGPSGSGEKMFKRRHVFPLSLFLWKERGPSFQHNGILWTKKTGQEAMKWGKKGNRFPASTAC